MRANAFHRIPEIKFLRFDLGWTLEKIAEKFGISRERVRQIIGNTGHIAYEKRRELFEKNKHLSNSKLAKLIGISKVSICVRYRNGERHEIDGGSVKIGASMEQLVSEELSKHGIRNKLMPHHHPFDILLDNGFRVDVKSANPLEILTHITPAYSFNTEQDKRGRYADFFICVLRDRKEFFVIPAKETKLNGTPIRFCFPKSRHNKPSKWLKYHNRFDLLKRRRQQAEQKVAA